MIAFWIAAALLAAAAAGLVLHRAAHVEARAGAIDPSLDVYRRQLGEIEDLSVRGLLPADEYRSARAEAARRLLAAADGPSGGLAGGRLSSKLGRRLSFAAAAIAPLVALAIYLQVGAPGFADQPFAHRVAAWRLADPRTLGPAEVVAVLTPIAAEHPRDPEPLYVMARAQLATGDSAAAARTLRKAIALAPRRVDLWTALGFTLAAGGQGQIGADALQAFRQANALDPKAPDPRYFLARAKIMGGDVKGGLDDWRALDSDLPAADPRKAALQQEIAAADKAGGVPPPTAAQAPAQGRDTTAFIQSMVDRLAARLETQPDDPAGWARLIHAYGVLGDEARRQAAITHARGLFMGRADALAAIDAAATGSR